MTKVHIVPAGEGGTYTATVNGVTVPVEAYAIESGPGSQAMVSLIVAADQVQIGIPPRTELEQTRVMEPPRRNNPPHSTWGDPSQPDPRRNIPGWQPPSASVDAGRNRTGEYPVVSHRRKP